MNYEKCESCGAQFLNSIKESRNIQYKDTMYCKNCVKQGRFSNKPISIEEAKKRTYKKMIDNNIPKFLAKFLLRNIKKVQLRKTKLKTK